MWFVNWSSLVYTSRLLLWLSILGIGLYCGTMIVLNVLETRGSVSSVATLLNWRLRNTKVRRLLNRWMPRLSLFIVGYILGQASLFSPIRELHGVEVTGKLADRVYAVIVPAKGNYPAAAADRAETLRLCSEGDDLPLKAGMVIEPLQYIQEKGCILINSDTYVDYLRNNNRDVVDRNGKLLFAKEE